MIFLTGATGFLGSQLLRRLLTEPGSEEVAVLIRADDERSARMRLLSTLQAIFPDGSGNRFLPQLLVVRGDAREDGFGISDSTFAFLADRISAVVHCAAATSFSQTLDKARESNVRGTISALNLAETAAKKSAKRIKFVHTSTAFVVGDTEQTVTADKLCLRQTFRNSYEQSKAEAEFGVLKRSNLLETTVFRPSVIVGDSITGHTSAFNVLYIPAKLVALGLCSVFPALPHTPLDVVPVDYVAEALSRSVRSQVASGSSFHLCSGVGRESSPKEVMEHIINICNERLPKGFRLKAPPFISPDLLLSICNSFIHATARVKSLERLLSLPSRLIHNLLPFIPYMTRNPRFDNSYTLKTLQLAQPPLFSNYAEQLFKYCLDTNWGRNRVEHRFTDAQLLDAKLV